MFKRFVVIVALVGAAPALAQNPGARAPRAPTDVVSGDSLIDNLAPPGRVVSERSVLTVALTEWRLSNGARVLVKPTEFKADEVVFTAYSPGGSSLVDDADFMSASLAANILQLGGLGRFSRAELDQRLAGKTAKVAASITSTSEELTGSASPQDLETLFQLIHLNFTAPRLDLAAFQGFKSRVVPMLNNRGSNAAAVFSDSVTLTMAQHHVRGRPLTAEAFNEVDPARALEIFRDRFGDAGDFTFVFVGKVDLAVLKSLSERYLANLPAAGRKERWKDTEPSAPKGVVEKTIRRGTTPIATTQILFHGPFQYAPPNRFAMRAMIELLQLSLTETLGAGSRVSVQGGPIRTPRPEYLIRIQYESSPANADKAAASVLSSIDALKTNGPRVADVDQIREQLRSARQVDLKTNAFWVINIAARDQAGEDMDGLLEPYDELIRKLTGTTIQQAARLYFDTKNFARFVLTPDLPKSSQ